MVNLKGSNKSCNGFVVAIIRITPIVVPAIRKFKSFVCRTLTVFSSVPSIDHTNSSEVDGESPRSGARSSSGVRGLGLLSMVSAGEPSVSAVGIEADRNPAVVERNRVGQGRRSNDAKPR